jgi:diguanylate cyclase (GGDEF)-like protein
MLMLVGFGLWQARKDAWEQAARSSTNLVAALSRAVSNNIDLADRSVLATRAGMQIETLNSYPAQVRRFILFGKGTGSPYVDRIFILNARGRLVADSTAMGTLGADFSDRAYYRYWRTARPDVAYFSRPVFSRFPDGSESIVLARRLTIHGQFAGVVAASIPLKLLQPTLDIPPGRKGAINLFALDGTVLVRNPALKPGSVHNIAGSKTFERMKREIAGHFVGRSAVDGEERLYTFSRPRDLPFILDVAISTETIMLPWWKRALPPIMATLALCAGVVALALLFQRELLRRERLEGKLATLAATDSLTGLPNRRSFDTAFKREMRRATRTRSPLSLLMIDVDQFKAFNDFYGHVAGDRALQQVARVIGNVAKRDADQTARLGGEEFAILLPDADEAGATVCGRQLLEQLRALRIKHDKSISGYVSVSIGIATRRDTDADETSLMLAADNALYAAKTNGRNTFTVRPATAARTDDASV